MSVEWLVFAASFGYVFFLGFNSKLLRDNKVPAGFVVSWLITVSQYYMMWAVAEAGLSTADYIWWSGWGGSIGITCAQFFYKWYDRMFHKEAVA